VASHEHNEGRVLPWMRGEAGRVSGSAAEARRRKTNAADEDEWMRGGDDGGGRCTMSAALAVLPTVWAVASGAREREETRGEVQPELAFYRKYTEGMLRRCLRLSMEAGRVPSLMGREMFRGYVTSYRVHGFDDVVIFVHDVERCLRKLTEMQRTLIERIALQEYTQGEAARLTGMSLRTVVRRYAEAVDLLTSIFLEAGLLEPLAGCQGVGR